MSFNTMKKTMTTIAVGALLLAAGTNSQLISTTATAVPISAPIATNTPGQPQPPALPNDQLLTHQGPGTGVNVGTVGVPPQPVPFDPALGQIEPNFPVGGPAQLPPQPNQPLFTGQPAFNGQPTIPGVGVANPQLQPQLPPQGQPPQFQPGQPLQPLQPGQTQPLAPQILPAFDATQPQVQPTIVQPLSQPELPTQLPPGPNQVNLAVITDPVTGNIVTTEPGLPIANAIAPTAPTAPAAPTAPTGFPAAPTGFPAAPALPDNFAPPAGLVDPNPNLQPGAVLTQPLLPQEPPTGIVQPGQTAPVPPAIGVGDINLSTPVITGPSLDPNTNTMFCPNHLKGCVVDSQILCIDQNLLVCHDNLLCPIEIPDVCVIKATNTPQCYNKNVLICKDGEFVPASDQ